MRCSPCFGANMTIFVAITCYIYRGFQVSLPILRCHRSPVHLEKNRMLYRLHELKHQVKNNCFDMMDTRLQIFTVSYLLWELHHCNEKGLLKDRNTWRAQAHLHLSAGWQIQQILKELYDAFGKHCWDMQRVLAVMLFIAEPDTLLSFPLPMPGMYFHKVSLMNTPL